MARKRKLGFQIGIYWIVICFCIFLPKAALAAENVEQEETAPREEAGLEKEEMLTEDAMLAAENGIIEVQSGFIDEKDDFQKMKSGSGFLISKEHNIYIVTSNRTVSNTPNEIEKYCKKNSIDTENTQFTNYIQIIIKGDVAVEAEVVVKSEEKDYCILSATNAVSQRETLKLGNSEDVENKDKVYALGFPEDLDGIEYSAADVSVLCGEVIDKEVDMDGNHYIAYSVPEQEVQGYAGGPLLDVAGYVIGLVCQNVPQNEDGCMYALSINEILSVLDNFSISYDSKQMDISKQESKIRYFSIAIIILAVCDGLLFVWMLVLIILNSKEKKQVEGESKKKEKRAEEKPKKKEKEKTSEAAAGRKLQLIYPKKNQTVAVSKTEFVLGKSQGQADFCMNESKLVSRRHAMLSESNGSWYIKDMNSLNGTYVNGRKLPSEQATKIKNGDEIRIADEVFQVSLETVPGGRHEGT